MSVILTIGLHNGDEGKGTIVDFLSGHHNAHTVVRYNGGSQAAHNVIRNGKHHTFAQFGSGTLAGAGTHLSRFVLVDPLNLLVEDQHLKELGITDAFSRMSLDSAALVITPFQKTVNKLREISRGDGRHGSCGMGIGETRSDHIAYGEHVLFIGDLLDENTLRRKLQFLREVNIEKVKELSLPTDLGEVQQSWDRMNDPKSIAKLIDTYRYFAKKCVIVDGAYLGKLLREPGTVIFEGAQGVLLDEVYGFPPYNTWSSTTLKNADVLLSEQSYRGQVTRLGILRSYATRHGPGPFVTEDHELASMMPEMHNQNNTWQREFRVGYFDLVTTRYALDVIGGVDAIAMTHLDRLIKIPEWKLCHGYNPVTSLDTTPYFEPSKGNIKKQITVQTPASLRHQERLTNILKYCTPYYFTLRHERGEAEVSATTRFLMAMEDVFLNIPVTIGSFGPDANNKRIYS